MDHCAGCKNIIEKFAEKIDETRRFERAAEDRNATLRNKIDELLLHFIVIRKNYAR